MRVVRPVVRSFRDPHFEAAVDWVRAGGHAICWLEPRKARLVFAKPREGDDFDLGYWSALDIGQSEYAVAKRGIFSGMAYVRIPHDCYRIVRDRATRDAIHPDPTRAIEVDCLACGACCKDNRVVLEEEDLTRFREAGRSELAQPPYARREDGAIVLVLQRNKRCKHLEDDNRCDIYPVRPNACRTFPPGSECCLSAREEEIGIIDGAPLD